LSSVTLNNLARFREGEPPGEPTVLPARIRRRRTRPFRITKPRSGDACGQKGRQPIAFPTWFPRNGVYSMVVVWTAPRSVLGWQYDAA
jgi:hypothetical protein